MKDHFFLALNNLKRRRLRAWLTILGIFIGIAAVVALITLGNGLREAIVGQFGALSADKLIIQNSGTGFGPPGSTSIRKLTSEDIKIIEQVDGVDEIVPRLIRIVKIEYNKAVIFSYVGSIPDNKKQIEIIDESFDAKIGSGRLLKQGDKGKIVLGSDMAKNSEFGKDILVGKNIIIQGKSFEVVGILEKSSSLQLNSIILMMEDDLKNILDIEDEIDLIVVQVKGDVEEVAEKIKERLRRDRNEKIGEEDFSVQTPLQSLAAVDSILTIINAIVAGIAGISLVVGGIGIANTMYTSVLERTREIGTMKAIGAKNSDILKIFLIEAGLLGLVGGIIGAGLGAGAAFLVSGIANSAFGSNILAVQLNFLLIGFAVGFSFFIGIFSGVFPAIQASKLNPVDALRG